MIPKKKIPIVFQSRSTQWDAGIFVFIYFWRNSQTVKIVYSKTNVVLTLSALAVHLKWSYGDTAW